MLIYCKVKMESFLAVQLYKNLDSQLHTRRIRLFVGPTLVHNIHIHSDRFADNFDSFLLCICEK